MSSSSSHQTSCFVPTYNEFQTKKILDLASPTKFNLSYDSNNPDLKALADQIFLRIFQNVRSIEFTESRSHHMRTRISTIESNKNKFSLVEREISYDGNSRDQWKGDISFLNSEGASLFSYVIQREPDAINKLIESNISIHTPDRKGNYPVHWMAKTRMTCDISSGILFTQSKEGSDKTPGHKSASIGENSVFLRFNDDRQATYQFTKKKHGKLIGTTWLLTPIFVALIHGHYGLVGTILSQSSLPIRSAVQTRSAIHNELMYKHVSLFTFAIELGCFVDLVQKIPFNQLEIIGENQFNKILITTAEIHDQKDVVTYLTTIRNISAILTINPSNITEVLSQFYEDYSLTTHTKDFARWILDKKDRSGRNLLEKITTFYPEIDSTLKDKLIEVYNQLDIVLPRTRQNQISQTQQQDPGVILESQTSHLPTRSNSLMNRITSLMCFILKPTLVKGVVFAVVAVAALIFTLRNSFAVRPVNTRYFLL